MNKDLIYQGITVVLVIFAVFLIAGRSGDNMNEEKHNDEKTEMSTGSETLSGDYSLEVDTEASSIEWQGQRTILTTHINKGTLNLSSGSLVIEDGMIMDGEFVVDMNSLSLSSVHGNGPREGGGDMLLGHLMSADFFDIENHPEATFTITSVEKAGDGHTVFGDMTIKGITNEIKFPVRFFKEDSLVIVEASLVLDRTLWDIRFGSENFFDDLGDKVIDNQFSLDLRLVFEGEVEAN